MLINNKSSLQIYACLDENCRRKYPGDDSRFAQLLLRLPALRSISLKCLELLQTYRLTTDKSLMSCISEILDETPVPELEIMPPSCKRAKKEHEHIH